jgi:antitoxin (DNA-binding transcriptional repressor) of toxin-antitoxin stability system
MDASIVDLRYHMKDVLRAIDRGETVTVLYRGKAKAKLMPISRTPGSKGEGEAKTENQPIFGLWRDRDDLEDPVSYVRRLRQSRLRLSPISAKRRRGAGKPE